MKNIDKYDLRTALVAYKVEMTERSNHGIEGLPFEDWVEEDVDTTAKLIAEKKREEEAAKKSVEEEKEAIRKGMAELKEFYKANGYGEANAIIDEVFKLDPQMKIYDDLASACNCFHSGMWSVWCEDYAGVWDEYVYFKNGGGVYYDWHNPVEWMKKMKELVQYIKPFIEEGKAYLEKLKAEGGAK